MLLVIDGYYRVLLIYCISILMEIIIPTHFQGMFNWDKLLRSHVGYGLPDQQIYAIGQHVVYEKARRERYRCLLRNIFKSICI